MKRVSIGTLLVCAIAFAVIPTAGSTAVSYWSFRSDIAASDPVFVTRLYIAVGVATMLAAFLLGLYVQKAPYLHSLLGYAVASVILTAALFLIADVIEHPIVVVIESLMQVVCIIVGISIGLGIRRRVRLAKAV